MLSELGMVFLLLDVGLDFSLVGAWWQRLDADEVHVLQEAVETGDTQDSDLDVKRTA